MNFGALFPGGGIQFTRFAAFFSSRIIGMKSTPADHDQFSVVWDLLDLAPKLYLLVISIHPAPMDSFPGWW